MVNFLLSSRLKFLASFDFCQNMIDTKCKNLQNCALPMCELKGHVRPDQEIQRVLWTIIILLFVFEHSDFTKNCTFVLKICISFLSQYITRKDCVFESLQPLDYGLIHIPVFTEPHYFNKGFTGIKFRLNFTNDKFIYLKTATGFWLSMLPAIT